MKQDFCFLGFVLDRSGSMGIVKEPTIQAFNHFVTSQKEVPGSAHLYLVQFDDEYTCVYDGDLKGAPELTADTFVPRNTTALWDAVGRTIDDVGKRLDVMPESDRPDKVVVSILTDGLENASRAYSREKLADMVKHQQEAYGWEFMFLGANQDAIMTGSRINIPLRSSITYDADKHAIKGVMAAASANLASYRTMGTRPRWTAPQRAAARAPAPPAMPRRPGSR